MCFHYQRYSYKLGFSDLEEVQTTKHCTGQGNLSVAQSLGHAAAPTRYTDLSTDADTSVKGDRLHHVSHSDSTIVLNFECSFNATFLKIELQLLLLTWWSIGILNTF